MRALGPDASSPGRQAVAAEGHDGPALVFVDFDDILFRRDGWVVCEVWEDRWVEGEGKGGV